MNFLITNSTICFHLLKMNIANNSVFFVCNQKVHEKSGLRQITGGPQMKLCNAIFFMFLATIFSLTSMSLASEAGKAQVIFEVG